MTPGEYRDLQNRVNGALATRSLAVLRTMPELDSSSWTRTVSALFAFISTQRRLSRQLALTFYASQSPTLKAPPAQPTVYLPEMTEKMLRRLLPASLTSEQRQQRATRVTAAVIRHGEQGGREALFDAAARDGVRWARTDPRPPSCGFCLVLISRGPVYASERSGGFLAHDYDTCVPVPVWPGRDWPGREQYERAERLYVQHAVGKSGKAAFAAMRAATAA